MAPGEGGCTLAPGADSTTSFRMRSRRPRSASSTRGWNEAPTADPPGSSIPIDSMPGMWSPVPSSARGSNATWACRKGAARCSGASRRRRNKTRHWNGLPRGRLTTRRLVCPVESFRGHSMAASMPGLRLPRRTQDPRCAPRIPPRRSAAATTLSPASLELH